MELTTRKGVTSLSSQEGGGGTQRLDLLLRWSLVWAEQ